MPIYTDGLGLSATALGQNDATPTADSLSDVTTTSAQAKVRLILARLATNAFTATIQGAARTELDVMLNTIATYFSAAGAAYSSVVNPGGSTRTEIETVLEDIADMLAGTAGIITYPAAVNPGDGADIAGVIRRIYDLVALIPTTAMRGTDNAALASVATEGRLAELDAANIPADVDKIPKSDGTASWNASALAAVNAEVDTALNTIVPASPTAGSLNDALSKAAGGNTFNKTTDSLEALSDKVALDSTVAKDATVAKAAAASEARLAELDAANLPADIDTIKGYLDTEVAAILADTGTDGVVVNSRTTAYGRGVGVKQILEVSVTSAANAGDVTLATVTTQPCLIKSIVLHSDTASQADLTSAAIAGGASKVVVFLSATDAAVANINAVDEQVAWTGAVRLASGKTIVISLVGTGATAVDLTVTIEYEACVAGGYLA